MVTRLILALLFLATTASAQSTFTLPAGSYEVIDGDTLRVSGPNVRLWGIDSVERGEPGYEAAGDALRAITGHQTLTCAYIDTDRFGRVVALCRRPDGVDLGAAMIAVGHAREFCRYSRNFYGNC